MSRGSMTNTEELLSYIFLGYIVVMVILMVIFDYKYEEYNDNDSDFINQPQDQDDP